MIEGIRRRLTLGYIGIFALILAVLGAVVLASFAGRVAAQQDTLLVQKAQGTLDYVEGRLVRPDREGRGPQDRPPGGEPPGARPHGEKHHEDRGHKEGRPPPSAGPIRASTDPEIGVVAVSPKKLKSRAAGSKLFGRLPRPAFRRCGGGGRTRGEYDQGNIGGSRG